MSPVNDYQLRLNLLLKEKASYFLTGLIIVFIALLSYIFLFAKTHSLTLYHQEASLPKAEKTAVAQQMTPSKPQVAHYTVQEGDNLWSIAQATYGDGFKAYDIARANNIADASVISAGQDLVLPGKDTEKIAQAVQTPPPAADNGQITEQAASTSQVTISAKTYTVQEGDYLWAIAEKVYGDGTMWPAIAQANNITNPDYIYKDTVLTLPQKS